ncbi:MAG TPA: hypothetical protein VE200_14585 [Xanthobacteraceae bacterium]|nr:hypothetical protein [Xanthobacteraceae bacterium]
MPPVLALYEDVLSNEAKLALPPLPRMIFVVHGGITIADRTLSDGDAWNGEGAATLVAGTGGATCWRFELGSGAATGAPATGVNSLAKLSARLDTLPAGDLLLRADSVGFPPGGCAYQHRHQGPGIRCLLEGGIRIDTHGRSTSYGPGGAWYETGPDAVFAQAAADRPSRFIRVMILPRALAGKSSIQYVNEADTDKPRVQQYKIFADAPIARPQE